MSMLIGPQHIKEIREKLHLSQQALGELVGVSQGCVGHWENGIRNPRYKELAKLAELYERLPRKKKNSSVA